MTLAPGLPKKVSSLTKLLFLRNSYIEEVFFVWGGGGGGGGGGFQILILVVSTCCCLSIKFRNYNFHYLKEIFLSGSTIDVTLRYNHYTLVNEL